MGSSSDTGGGPPVGVDASRDTSAQDTAGGCTTNADCAKAFADLGVCQVVECQDKACVRANRAEGASCDDGDPCSSGDACAKVAGDRMECVPKVASCDDGDFCNGVETCDGAAGCKPGTPPKCDDDDPCTADTCDDAKGSCVFTPSAGGPCDDGDACTKGDLCTADGGCVGQALECDDGDPCNGSETCDRAKGCQVGEAIVCNDGNDCTVDSCSKEEKGCIFVPALGVTCEDGSQCTDEDLCDAQGSCFGLPKDCSDGVACTVDSCDPDKGCSSVPDAGRCADGNGCTTEVCDPVEGCQVTLNTELCDDGNPCTSGDVCHTGSCDGTPDLSCACTGDKDCGVIEDDDLCNGTLICLLGKCVVDPLTVVTCPVDGFACTKDWSCAPATGLCTGSPVGCDDGDACTADSCSPTQGCRNDLIAGCASAWICEISGSQGDKVECVVQVARSSAQDPAPTGADFKLSWDGAKLKLDNLVDAFCLPAVGCFPFDIVTCAAQDKSCTYAKVEPSGHDMVGVPADKADWSDWFAVLLFHSGDATTPLTEALLDSSGDIAGDPQLFRVRMELLADIPAGAPVKVKVSDFHFNPPTGQPMKVRVDDIGGQKTFIVSGQ